MRYVLSALLLLVGVAAAHSELVAASPTQNAVVTALPKTVTLRFSEALELPFSTFKVYPLEAEANVTDPQRLNGLGAALMNDALTVQGDEAARADTGVIVAQRQSAEVALPLKGDLGPGHYVVMWRALSVDTHTTTGFYVFTYAPGG